jgi:hypothetical protein
MLKGSLRSRTMRVMVLLAVLGALEAASGAVHALLEPWIGSRWAGSVIMLIAVLGAALRVITSKPLDER